MFGFYVILTLAFLYIAFICGVIGYLICKYWKKKQRMRIQTALSDKLKKHSSHHTFIPDWIHDCAEWENDDILIEKVEQKK